MNFLGRILWVTVGASAANVVGIPIAAVTWIFPVVGVMALAVGLLVWSSTAPAAPLGAVPMRDRSLSSKHLRSQYRKVRGERFAGWRLGVLLRHRTAIAVVARSQGEGRRSPRKEAPV